MFLPIVSLIWPVNSKIKVVDINKKDVEPVSFARSTYRGRRNCPYCQNEQPKTPTPIWNTSPLNWYTYIITRIRNTCARCCDIDTIRACIESYPWASTVAMLLDSICSKVSYAFGMSENKARDKRLFHICNLPVRRVSRLETASSRHPRRSVIGVRDITKL